MRASVRWLVLTLALTVGAGCSYFRGSSADEPPVALAPAAVSSVHYRAFDGADSLAAYLRWQPGAPVLVSAQRGAPSPGLPENALVTFEHALNFAPVLVHTTVQATADDRLVLFHDATLERTTTGTGLLAVQTLAALRTLRLLDPLGQLTAQRIPTLDEALAWADGRAVLLLDPEGLRPEIAIAAIRREGVEERTVLQVASLAELLLYYGQASDLVYAVPVTSGAEADALLAAAVDPARLLALAGPRVPERALVQRLHAAGIRVQAGPPDTTTAGPAAYRPYLDAGVDVLAAEVVLDAAIAAAQASMPSSQVRR